MPDQVLISLLRQWHDFYSLAGTAAATLVGLMFVAASIGSGVFTRKVATEAFLYPTVVHFSAILFICLIAIAPTETWTTLGLLLTCGGLGGVAYVCLIWRRMIKHGFTATIDLIDRWWYTIVPIAGYLLVALAGLSFLRRNPAGFQPLGIALMLLMLVGIRNAWDMTVWTMQHRER